MKTHDIMIGKTASGDALNGFWSWFWGARREQGGNYLTLSGTEHVIVYARTRSGKTVGMSIPNAFAWRGSLVALDVKGELWNATAGYRAEALGHRVIKLDPASREREGCIRTHRWNPLSAVDRESIDRFDMIRRFSYSLWPDASSLASASSNADKFWEPKARSAWEGVTTLLAETPNEALTMANVLRFFASTESYKRLADMIEERRVTNRPYSQAAVDQVADYMSGGGTGDDRQREGIRASVTAKLAPWFSPRMQAATEVSDFDLRDLRRKPMAIYLSIAPGNIPRMRPYITLFFESLIALNSDVLPEDDPAIEHQTLLLLDEFLRVGRLPELADSAQYIAGYGMRLLIIVQDKQQLAARYGKDVTGDLFANTGAEIAFAVNDLETTQELSERLGFNTVPISTDSRPRWWGQLNFKKQSIAVHPNKRSILLPQEIARMARDEQIVLRPGMMPIKCKRIRWFEDEGFVRDYRNYPDPPEVPKVEIRVPLDDGSSGVLTERR